MKITDSRLTKLRLFKDIKIGEVFLDDDEICWLKIPESYGGNNAIALDDGTTVCWEDTEKVYPVEAELIIK